jgi:hypothetical protein
MDLEQRAREMLGLESAVPRRLSMRIEYLWRAESFAPVVPFGGSIFLPLGRDVNLDLLRESLMLVMARHEVLRSRLAHEGDHAVLAPDVIKPPDLAIVDVPRAVIAAHREGGTASALSEFVETQVHLTSESGFRTRLFRDEDGDIVLGLMLHHYFGDGWSSQVLRREIATTYAALKASKLPEFAPAASYAEYAVAQRQALNANLENHLGYWRAKLEKRPSLKLPYDHVRDTNQMGRIFFGLSEDTATRLTEIAQARRISVFVIYLAALHLLLARWCGTKHAVTAVNTADRVKPQFLNTVGYLIASLPIASGIDENLELGAFLSAMAKNFYDAYGHRDLSYDLYDAVCQPPGPFCTTLFNFIPLQEKLSAVKSQTAAPPPTEIFDGPPIPRVRVHREIYFCLVEMPRGMVGKVYYNLDFFSRETFVNLITRFGRILEKMSESPETKLAEIT